MVSRAPGSNGRQDAPVARPPTWLGLAAGGPVREVAETLEDGRLTITDDPHAFARLLIELRPRIAILAQPPGGSDDLDGAVAERHRRSTMRLVHVSPADGIEARLIALERGVDDAVSDTIAVAELLARLRILDLRTRRRPEDHVPVADGVVIDLVAHEVRRDGERIHLRPKEFQLLAMLAAHPGRAYTRRQLLDRVWGQGHDGDPRTVDVHVRWLRAKIERRPEAPAHLVTVRGVGYRLDPLSG